MMDVEIKLADLRNGEVVFTGMKSIYNLDGKKSATDWVNSGPKGELTRPWPVSSSGLKFKEAVPTPMVEEDFLGFMTSQCNNVYHNPEGVSLMSTVSSVPSGFNITPENFERVCVFFAARRSTQRFWHNFCDEYMAPTAKLPLEFIADCVVYTIFNVSSNQSARRQASFRGEIFDVPNHWFWLHPDAVASMAHGKFPALESDAARANDDCDSRFVHDWIMDLKSPEMNVTMSPEAAAVICRGTDLLTEMVPLRAKFNESNPEMCLYAWDAGYYQMKKLAKLAGADAVLAPLKAAYKKLEASINARVYEYGFLKSLTV